VILSDATIRAEIAAGRIVVDPFDDAMVQPSSIDVRLDDRFLVFRSHTRAVIDVKEDLTDLTELVKAPAGEPFILHPGEFVLGATAERVALPEDIVGRIEGKSSLGRLGLLIHTTAGFVDAGFEGYLTLELSNVATLPITLYPGMKIGQISFLRMDRPAETPYGASSLGSKYRGQVGPTASQYWKNFES
jgi:dCTP deaminase